MSRDRADLRVTKLAESFLILGVLVSFAASAAEVPRFVPSVLGAYNGLSKRPDALAFARSGSRAGTTCKHYQGIARKNGPDGTPYVFMSKSGNKSICLLQDDEPGTLIVARLGSRPKHGERLRSNVFPYGSMAFSAFPEPHPTFAEDHVVTELKFNDVDLPAYRHPGGMQVIGDVLIVGAETPFGSQTRDAVIFFFDISDPESPTLTSRLNLADLGGGTFGADPVGITAVKGTDGSCCRYLLVSAGGDGNDQLRFYLSRTDPDSPATDLKSETLAWDELGRFSAGTLSGCMGADWPTAGLIQGGQHQLLNLVREGNLDGQLYLIGGRRDGTIATPLVDELLDLYQVNIDSDGAFTQACPLTHIGSKTMDTDAWANQGTVNSFSAASGVYVSPSGELIVYGGRHDAVIFNFGDLVLSDHVAIGEYRIGSLVRANSPTLRPTTTVGGPFAVDEGSSVPLTGGGDPAIQKAFAQLFEDDGVGLSLPGLIDDDEWFSVEFEDRDKDAFGQLDLLDGDAGEIDENAGSWRWFAPFGCTISANDYPTRSDDWPGPDTVFLRGNGVFQEALDLDNLPVFQPAGELFPVSPVPGGTTPTTINYDDDIGGITFFRLVPFGGGTARLHDCESYYAAALQAAWDFDGDGSYEGLGSPIPFSAATLDGPSTATVRARAKHPTDPTPIGLGDPVSVAVQVRNVPPAIASATVVDSLGQSLGGGAIAALAGLPVTLAVTFTDAGRPDTQTGHVAWGDGDVDTTFTSFSSATGGVTGGLQHAHVFHDPGSFTITTTITDDDGGATPVDVTIRVLSLEDAIEDVADQLTELIALAATPQIAAALTSARDELIGNHTGHPPTNGALDKLDAGDPSGAITKLRAAIEDLITAESLGAGDLTTLKNLLGLVAEGIATGVYEEARASLPAPSPGQTKALATIASLIAQGHADLLAGQYLKACDRFRQATDKALALMR